MKTGANATTPETDTTLTTCEPCLYLGLECSDAPDAAEIVRAQHGLDPFRLEREEGATAGYAGVVHEQVDARMALENGRGGPVDLFPIGDVAELELAAELVREWLEPLLPPGDEHAVPAASDELPRDRSPMRRGAGRPKLSAKSCASVSK